MVQLKILTLLICTAFIRLSDSQGMSPYLNEMCFNIQSSIKCEIIVKFRVILQVKLFKLENFIINGPIHKNKLFIF